MPIDVPKKGGDRMLTITVRLDEKRSTASQYENRTAGVVIEASGLELHSGAEILAKADALWALAQESVARQFGGNGTAASTPEPQPAPSNGNGSNGNGHPAAAAGNGHGNGTGNGRRSYGRPQDAPSPKQRAFLAKLARERNLGPESIRDMAVRVTGKEPKVFTKQDMSKFIESLLAAEQAA
jgi:hypothetical protein